MAVELQSAPRARIAVVGGGVSGLVAAHLLHPDHELSVFEAGGYPGGHTNTIEVETERGPLAVGEHTAGVAAGGLVAWRTGSIIGCVVVAAAVTAALRAM